MPKTPSAVVNSTPCSRQKAVQARDPLVVQPSGGVLDEANFEPSCQETSDRRVVTDVGRDAEDDDLVGVEHVEETPCSGS